MKKIIFLSLITLVFLAGCGKKTDPVALQPDQASGLLKPFERILPPDTGNYPKPKINIGIGTGTILAEFTGKVRNEISYTATNEQKENGRKVSVVSGYLYTYVYEDLGLKITTAPLYEPYFYEQPTEPILQRYNNIVYFSNDITLGGEYIEMFLKDPSVSLKTMIEEKHLGTGCIAYNGRDAGYDPSKDTWFQLHGRIGVDINNFFDITGPGGSLGTDIECRPDSEYPDSYGSIFFVQSKFHKDRYYKISMGDACAPGPCSIFGDIEFF